MVLSGNTVRPNLASLLIVDFRKYQKSISSTEKRGYSKFGAFFHDKNLKTEKHPSGNPVMQKLATLSVVWFRKWSRLSYHLKIWTCTNFEVSVVILKEIIWKEHYLATLHCRIWQPCWSQVFENIINRFSVQKKRGYANIQVSIVFNYFSNKNFDSETCDLSPFQFNHYSFS